MNDGSAQPPGSDPDIAISGDVKGGIVNIGGTQDFHGDVHVGDVHQTPRGWRLFGVGVIGVLIVIAGGVMLSLLPRDTINSILGIPSDTPTATLTHTPTPTSTPTATPTFTPTPEYAPAVEGELLIIVAEFDRAIGTDNDPATVFEWALQEAASTIQQEQDVSLRIARTATLINSMEQAKALSDEANATIVIWGRLSKAGLNTFFRIDPRWNKRVYEQVQNTKFEAQADLDEVAFHIEKATEPLYIVNFIIGQILYADKQYAKALPFLEKAIDLLKNEPEQTQREMGMAAAYFYAGYIQDEKNTEVAITLYTASLTLESEGKYAPSAYNNRGGVYYNAGDYDRAIADYDSAIELNPNLAEAYYNRGTIYNNIGEYDRAIADFTVAIELNPQYTAAYNNRGIAYSNAVEIELAITDFTIAIDLNPEYAEAYYNRGIAYYDTGEYDRAIADHTKAIELNPDYVDAYVNRALTYLSTGDYDQVITDFDKVLALNPDDAIAAIYLVRGTSHFYVWHSGGNVQHLTDAESDLTQVIRLDTDKVFGLSTFANRCTVYAMSQRLEEALADCNHAIELAAADDYFYTYSHIVRGVIYNQLNQPDEAAADFATARTYKPDNARALMGLADAYYDVKMNAEALEAYRRYVALAGDLADTSALRHLEELEAKLTPTPAPGG